jgi:hypothetical protein
MSRYIERDTELEVDVTCIMSYRGEPIGAIVTMPDGVRYSLPADRMDMYFQIVTPQTIELTGVMGGHKYDRSPTLAEVERNKRLQAEESERALRVQVHGIVADLDEARRLLQGRD